MENLKGKTPIELQKMFNDLGAKHELLKEEITGITFHIDELSESLNEKLSELTELEKNYVLLVEEIDTE